LTNNRLIHGDCLEVLPTLPHATCLFADPPDNIGLKYTEGNDKLPDWEYINLFESWLRRFIHSADIVWVSYNARWFAQVGAVVNRLLDLFRWLRVRQCVQTFTFGQHQQKQLGNNYRPLLLLHDEHAKFYPDQIRVQSWRQKCGDKRADPRGRVPGDVFDFPRVVGNSKQRRSWCPTQLHEGLVERCIRFSTADLRENAVIDPFAGSGTTLRVCKRISRPCTLIERCSAYCSEIAKEHALEIERPLGRARNAAA